MYLVCRCLLFCATVFARTGLLLLRFCVLMQYRIACSSIERVVACNFDMIAGILYQRDSSDTSLQVIIIKTSHLQMKTLFIIRSYPQFVHMPSSVVFQFSLNHTQYVAIQTVGDIYISFSCFE